MNAERNAKSGTLISFFFLHILFAGDFFSYVIIAFRLRKQMSRMFFKSVIELSIKMLVFMINRIGW
jgi:hypothetical protein